MTAQKAVNFILLLVLILLAGVELFCVYNETLNFSEAWFLLLLVFLGFVSLLSRPGDPTVAVLCLLLASLSVLVSFVIPEELLVLGGWLGTLCALFWSALLRLFPFVFVHFSLIFPVTSEWVAQRPRRLALLYIPYGMLLVLDRIEPLSALNDLAVILCIPLGFALGLAMFVRQYLYSLTTAEKNRLRVVLIGCLAGGVPRILSLLGAAYLPLFTEPLAYFLQPLFPLCLAFAVLKENFSEIGRAFQHLLVYSVVSAGVFTGFLVSSILLSLFWAEEVQLGPTPLLISLALSLILFYPLQRWAGSYVSAHFYTHGKGQPKNREVLPKFHPIEPNPYIVGNPVRSPEMFFGRKEDFQFIRTKLENQRQGCIMVLCGERRTGKTSILYQILNGRLGDRFIPVFVDMQGVVVDKDQEFLQVLAEKVSTAISGGELSSNGALPRCVTTYLDFNGFMDAVAHQSGAHHLVLLIDEYELIENKVKDGKISAEMYDYLNSLLERYPRLSFVFTGSHELEADSGWSRLLGKSFYREITFLGRKDTEELICAPLQDRVLFRSGVISGLLRLTHGHPFYTQLLCQSMVEVLNERQSNTVDRKIVEEVVQRVLENPPPQLLYRWTALSNPEKLILSASATLLKSRESYVSSGRVDRLIRSLPEQYRQQLDITQTRMHLEGLRRCYLLDRDQTRYRFTMDLLRLWIQVEHNVWNVLNEIATSET
ncbi:MAG: AAA family ATPase [Acidobacteriota bacterium]